MATATTPAATKTVAYYPGCVLKNTMRSFGDSTRLVSDMMGINLREVKNYNCCGIGELKRTGDVSLLMNARNLSLIEHDLGLDEVVMPCNICYHEGARTNHIMQTKPERFDSVNSMLEEAGEATYHAQVEVRHFTEYLYNEFGPEAIKEHVVRPLTGLKVACYYGCLYTRPSTFTSAYAGKPQRSEMDDAFRPRFMHEILEAAGATVVDFGAETQCCGGKTLLHDETTSRDLCGSILTKATAADADVIAAQCPKCGDALDVFQPEIIERWGEEAQLPVVYYTQLLALAMGASPRQARLGELETRPLNILREKGVA